MAIGKQAVDEQSLIHDFPTLDRKASGAFFTPATLVDAVLDAVLPLLPTTGPVCVLDPSCGAGAFLSRASERLPKAHLRGLELHGPAAEFCGSRVPRAQILCGDGLGSGFERLTASIPESSFEVWVGNPPYNGTSAVLKDPARWRGLASLVGGALPRGQSLRDDFAFFLLRAATHLASRRGVLAFVTPASLLDGYLYAPLRAALMERLQLSEVVEVGAGAFEGTRVKTCFTVWRSAAAPRVDAAATRYRTRSVVGTFDASQLHAPIDIRPGPPDQLLRPAPGEAEALETRWRRDGEPLTRLVPVSAPGLKTRFDELLVDDDPERLVRRVTGFVACGDGDGDALRAFAQAWQLPERVWPKLKALKAHTGGPFEVTPRQVRPFYRYAGARHRGLIPESARAFCYLDRRLIPRGDHRLRGDWDPHLQPVKLVFNVRELPLSAALLDRDGCVHDHRHARFAPLFVPQRVRDEGPGATRDRQPLGPDVANLSPVGLRWAEALGGPLRLFEAIVAFINSEQVQRTWAPTFGAARELHVTYESLARAL